jgi:Reverse transcriptase (RNA-dependent DNA polymerase)
MWRLPSIIIDVETAFLHGDLKKTIYMQAPKGTDIPKDLCIKRNKALYGLVQAARKFYLKFSRVLHYLGFTISYADPCLFHQVNQYGRIIMIFHVDDCYTI